MKYFVFTLFILLPGIILAQEKDYHNGFKKGDQFISGLVGYTSLSGSSGDKERSFNISPRYGYFLNDFIAVGGRLGYSYYRRKDREKNSLANNSALTLQAFGRYYLLPGSQFSVFGELGVGFGFSRNMAGDWTNGINVGFSPGLSYFLAKHFALEASFGILSYDTVSPPHSTGTTDSFKVGVDLENINFGIIYKF